MVLHCVVCAQGPGNSGGRGIVAHPHLANFNISGVATVPELVRTDLANLRPQYFVACIHVLALAQKH